MWADSQHPPVDSHTGLMSIHGEWVTPNGQTYLLSGCVLDCVHTQESIVVGQTSGMAHRPHKASSGMVRG